MPRPLVSAARFVACFFLTALVGLAPLSARPVGECDPAPTTADKIRPVASKSVPTAPSPLASAPPPRTVSAANNAEPPTPCVAVRVRVPAEIAPGQEIKYRILAENVSRADAHHVTVRVPAPINAKFVRATPAPTEKEPSLIWKLGTLRGGEKKEIEMIALPTGEGDVNCCARVSYEHGQCVKTKLTRPGVQIKKTGPGEAAKYDPLKYEIEVSNTGKAMAKNVIVEETLPKGLDYSNSTPSTSGENPLRWKLGDVEPGKTKVIRYDLIPSELGSLETKAVVTAEGGAKRETSHSVRIGEPALAVALSGPKHRYAGRAATYRLTVRNAGTVPARNVELSDELPAEIEFLKSPTGKLDRDHVRWKLGTLAPGASKTVEATVRATKAGDFKNVVTATADRGLSEQSMMRTRFDLPGGLMVEADKVEDALSVGQTTTWTLRVLNRGKTPQSKVIVVVNVPEGLKADVRAVPGARVEDRRVVLPELTTLSPGAEQSATLRLTAGSAGDHVVAVTAGSTTVEPGGVRVEETLRVGDATTSRRQGERSRSSFGP